MYSILFFFFFFVSLPTFCFDFFYIDTLSQEGFVFQVNFVFVFFYQMAKHERLRFILFPPNFSEATVPLCSGGLHQSFLLFLRSLLTGEIVLPGTVAKSSLKQEDLCNQRKQLYLPILLYIYFFVFSFFCSNFFFV